jgi:hypothetical protein
MLPYRKLLNAILLRAIRDVYELPKREVAVLMEWVLTGVGEGSYFSFVGICNELGLSEERLARGILGVAKRRGVALPSRDKWRVRFSDGKGVKGILFKLEESLRGARRGVPRVSEGGGRKVFKDR